MNVLLINQHDIFGGAGIAGHRLYKGLSRQGVGARMLVEVARTNDDAVAAIARRWSILEKVGFRITRRLSLSGLHVNSFTIAKHDFYMQADIINFHNLHGGFFNYLAIPRLTNNKPAVYTLHDMWSFTGHCSYSYDCDKWKAGCGNCPYPHSYPGIERDNTRLEWKLKKRTYQQSRLTIVTPSRWLASRAKESMLNRFPIHHIPNGLDTDEYRPLEKEQCRAALGISRKTRVLLFVAQSVADPRKGGGLLLKSLMTLPAKLKSDCLLVTIGDGGEKVTRETGMKTLNLGYVSGDLIKSICYSAADIFLFPTKADNLPVVLQESMACGTPMISFNIGGVPDLVRHGITGYLAEPGDVAGLRECILQLLENGRIREQMSRSCRAIAVEEYGIEMQTKRYIELFQNSLRKEG